MKFHSMLIALVALGASSVSAQNAVVDLSAKSAPFSAEQYAQLLKCTLERHPEETRRYAAYHFQRRDVQTPTQNEADPDSSLMILIIKSCYKLESGKVIPFSLDSLTADWAKAHGISIPGPKPRIATSDELAQCVYKNDPALVEKILAEPRPGGFLKNFSKMIGKDCWPANNIRLDADRIYSKFEELAGKDAKKVAE